MFSSEQRLLFFFFCVGPIQRCELVEEDETGIPGMCEHPPMTLCRRPTAKEPVMYDPDGDTCNYHRPGRNCLAGDNRFRDMASCEAACGGPRRNPACSAPVRMHTCIPGVETNSSAHYHFADYCLPVDRGYCLIGQGFSSEQECIDVCKDEGTNPAECENNNLAVCNLSAHLYQVAFFRGHCERRAHICPRSVGFTSVSHCARMCTSARTTEGTEGRTERWNLSSQLRRSIPHQTSWLPSGKFPSVLLSMSMSDALQDSVQRSVLSSIPSAVLTLLFKL